jgi:acyl-coenzyme A synthetase/AMP-(fatty) acid ligase
MITPLPGAWPEKPGSASLPFFGVKPVIVDEKGVELEGGPTAAADALRAADSLRGWGGAAGIAAAGWLPDLPDLPACLLPAELLSSPRALL